MFGFLNFSMWQDVIVTLILTQITIISVTLYLHRSQAHRSVIFHPLVNHFFRGWLWLTTGMVTAEWVAIHRKHHAATDVEGDPHSPQVLGINKVLWEGAELYRAAAKDRDMVKKYAHGTPNDWVERHVYSRYPVLGVSLMLILDLLLFGLPGLSMWAIQMIWIPFHAAGVINGIGHYFGYRNFECPDAATNIIPWAFWIGGEELHNNHHTFASSAKFSVKWWEFDIGWLVIRILSLFKLARVKKLPPKLLVDKAKGQVDFDTVKAVIANRFQVMADYYKQVIRPMVHAERTKVGSSKLLDRAASLLAGYEGLLSQTAKTRLNLLLSQYERLRIVHQYRQSLQQVWLKTAASQKDLVEALQQWCKQAEASGLDVLRQFANQMKGYQSLSMV